MILEKTETVEEEDDYWSKHLETGRNCVRMISKIMTNKNGKLIARLATNTLIFSQGKGPNGWGPRKCACGMNCS
jgi:hypothetical protein